MNSKNEKRKGSWFKFLFFQQIVLLFIYLFFFFYKKLKVYINKQNRKEATQRAGGRENPLPKELITKEHSNLEESKKEDNYKRIYCFYSTTKKQRAVHYYKNYWNDQTCLKKILLFLSFQQHNKRDLISRLHKPLALPLRPHSSRASNSQTSIRWGKHEEIPKISKRKHQPLCTKEQCMNEWFNDSSSWEQRQQMEDYLFGWIVSHTAERSFQGVNKSLPLGFNAFYW